MVRCTGEDFPFGLGKIIPMYIDVAAYTDNRTHLVIHISTTKRGRTRQSNPISLFASDIPKALLQYFVPANFTPELHHFWREAQLRSFVGMW